MTVVPDEKLEAFASLHLPAVSDRRLRALMDRNNDGLLTADEHAELESLVEISEMISLARADALELLGRSPL